MTAQESTTTDREERTSNAYASDAPIALPQEDRFGRWPFAQRLADAITKRPDPASLVVAVYGAWGQGKTSVLNLLVHALSTRNASSVIVYRFNPWRYQDDTTLLKSFFDTMAEQLGRQIPQWKRKSRKLFNRYGRLIASIAGRGELADAIKTALDATPLEELREKIEEALEEAEKRVVVILDDLDRLERREIQAIFRLLKLVANFRHTVYLLAFDPEIVAEAIAERYAGHRQEAGLSFLDKIVQVPLQLPAARPEAIRAYFFEGVEAVLGAHDIDLTQEQVRRLIVGYNKGLEVRIRSPRDAKRFGNTIAFALPLLRHEVDVADLMLVEGIRLFYPRLYRSMSGRPDLYTAERLGMSDDRAKEEAKREIEAVISDHSDTDRAAGIELLQHLLPRLEVLFDGSSYADSWDQEWARDQRLSSRDYYLRYFSYQVGPNELSDRNLDEFLQSLSSIDESAIQRRLIDLTGADDGSPRAGEFVEKMRGRAASLDPGESSRLARALARSGAAFPNPPSFLLSSPLSRASMLISDLLDNLAVQEERINTATEVISQAEPIWFAAEIALWLRDEPERGANVFSEEELAELRALLVDRIRSTLAEFPEEFDRQPRELTRCLLAWLKYGEQVEVREAVRRLIGDSPQRLPTMIRSVLGTSWGGDGYPSEADLNRSGYDAISDLAGAEFALGVLDELFPNALTNLRYSRHQGDLTDRDLAGQFVAIHQEIQQRERKADESASPPSTE